MRNRSLAMDHGPRVHVEVPTLAELAAVGRADPELLRMEFDRLRLKQADDFVAARFEPAALRQCRQHRSRCGRQPAGPPTISGTTFTIDIALQNPTRVITPMVLDLTRQRFFVDRVFASAGGVTGGAVIYDVVVYPDLYADRDVERVEPGSEFPIVSSAAARLQRQSSRSGAASSTSPTRLGTATWSRVHQGDAAAQQHDRSQDQPAGRPDPGGVHHGELAVGRPASRGVRSTRPTQQAATGRSSRRGTSPRRISSPSRKRWTWTTTCGS
jgi:hypothetical protein